MAGGLRACPRRNICGRSRPSMPAGALKSSSHTANRNPVNSGAVFVKFWGKSCTALLIVIRFEMHSTLISFGCVKLLHFCLVFQATRIFQEKRADQLAASEHSLAYNSKQVLKQDRWKVVGR